MTEPKTIEQHFNKLTPAEAELLTLLAEECAEIVQIVCKIQRHGLTSYHPNHPERSNRAELQREMGDVRAAMILLCQAGVTDKNKIHKWADEKIGRVQQYLHHARVSS